MALVVLVGVSLARPAHAQSIIFADYETLMICYDPFDVELDIAVSESNTQPAFGEVVNALANFIRGTPGAEWGSAQVVKSTWLFNTLTGEEELIDVSTVYEFSMDAADLPPGPNSPGGSGPPPEWGPPPGYDPSGGTWGDGGGGFMPPESNPPPDPSNDGGGQLPPETNPWTNGG